MIGLKKIYSRKQGGFMNKYQILILSNMVGSGLKDDLLVKVAFEEDGHDVQLVPVNYDPKLEDNCDVIIRRNTWANTEEETADLYAHNQALIKRLSQKSIKTVNLVGLDGVGKQYLCEMFDQNYPVIPTICKKEDISRLPKTNKYVSKNMKSFGSGLHQRTVFYEDLESEYNNGDILQPFLSFQGELQCYYVGTTLMYVFYYTPSKYPDYPEPTLVELTPEQKSQADRFAKYSKVQHGFQRIDFLRMDDDSLLLMEIEDHAAFMNLNRLPELLQQKVLLTFKENIYSLLEC